KGKYEVFTKEKIDSTPNERTPSRSTCENWKKIPNATFEVSGNEPIAFTIHKSCNPCEAPAM
ncbi:hypothetical protein, partial [Fulvivirga aurantia]|uniref:hypothetical protein n=1 Tax=Fulvivirga aurantia TaxID=2529383 RepID=UPI001CA3E86C